MTRLRLIEAAERLFVRRGFDDASVEEISEMAGYSRGAFYSNFDSKDQVFLAVIDRRRPKALDDIFQRVSEPVERIAAVRTWFANQWRFKDFIALRMEFSRRALEIAPSGCLAELLRQELKLRHGGRFLCASDEAAAERPEIVVLVLLAALPDWAFSPSIPIPNGSTSCGRGPLVFDRMTTSNFPI